jgi:hypothetical protein
VMKNLKKPASSRKDRFAKTLFIISYCMIAEDNGFGELLFRSRMHVSERDEVALETQQWRRQKPRCVGDSWLFVVTHSMAATHIYREDLPKVTSSHNRLGLSLLKHIRHGLIAKINGKRRPRTCETLGRILAYYSHARQCASHASPRLATPRHRACVFLSFSSPPHTCKCIESNPSFKYASLNLH